MCACTFPGQSYVCRMLNNMCVCCGVKHLRKKRFQTSLICVFFLTGFDDISWPNTNTSNYWKTFKSFWSVICALFKPMLTILNATETKKLYNLYINKKKSWKYLTLSSHCFQLHLYIVNICTVYQPYFIPVLFISLLVNVPPLEYCTMDLSQENHDALVYAVKNHYWYQMYIGRFLYHDT